MASKSGNLSGPVAMEVVEEEDNIVCEICLNGTVYEGNEILFCDKCNVAVHQGCYSVKDIPEGSWFCYPCAAGLDTATLPCEVCPFTGGAYKPTFKTGKWAHSLCCQWIPETFVTLDPKMPGVPCINLTHLDKKRMKLHCHLCRINRGACVQCCYGRCVTAAHPWCVLKTPQGCTRRVVLDPDGNNQWETFCKVHASSVSEPYKPKAKAKMQVPIDPDEDYTPSVSTTTATASARKEGRSSMGGYNPAQPTVGGRLLSMEHAKNFLASRLLAITTAKEPRSALPSRAAFVGADNGDNDRSDGADSDDDSDAAPSGSRRKGKTIGKKGTKGLPSRSNGTTPRSTASGGGAAAGTTGVTASRSFPILNMLEWPGISEGEPMDLDHFWNVVSGYFPEDHSEEWLEYMLAGLQEPVVPAVVQSVLPTTSAVTVAESGRGAPTPGGGRSSSRSRGALSAHPAEGTSSGSKATKDSGLDLAGLAVMPALGNARNSNKSELVETAEELLTAFGGERERSAVLDEDKRTNMLLALSQRLKVIQGEGSTTAIPKSESGYFDEPNEETKSRSSSYADVTAVNKTDDGAAHCSLILSENEFYTRPGAARHPPRTAVEDIDYVNDQGCATLRAVFDGPRRFACDFKVFLPDPSLPAPAQAPPPLPPATKHRRSGKWHQVGLSGDEVVESAKWAAENLIPPGAEDTEGAISSAIAMREDGYASLSIALEAVEPVAESTEVQLTDRVIIPRDEDNSLCRAIRTDVHAYTVLTSALQGRIKTILEQHDPHAMSGTLLRSRSEWDAIDQLYLRQQVWKQVCTSLNRGIRDQLPDFNKSEEEALPASWQIEVQGRPKVDEEEAEAEPHEDAVCMCCFDGTSVEGNRILFCDGCNAALHQICYGVPKIPEGDFFCDRCQYIQLLANDAPHFDYYHARTAVMCCLCPLQHGGLKPTTDGRWVHLSCAMWGRECTIQDMTDMGPINISKVPVQMPDADAPVTTSWGRAVKPTVDDQGAVLYRQNCTISPLADPCMFCKLRGGLVQQCCAEVEGGCGKTFHPICAWFEGLYMSSAIQDPTFQGVERGGQYPSGLTFRFYCDAHSIGDGARPVDRGPTIREEQRALRCKYRINEDDLEQIPGQNRRKRKKPRKERTTLGGRGAGSSGADQRELNPDVYDCSCCAACLEPMSGDVFGTGTALVDGRPAWELAEEAANLTLGSPGAIAATPALLGGAVGAVSSPGPHLESALADGASTPAVAVKEETEQTPNGAAGAGGVKSQPSSPPAIQPPSPVAPMSAPVLATADSIGGGLHHAAESQSSIVTDSLAVLPSLQLPVTTMSAAPTPAQPPSTPGASAQITAANSSANLVGAQTATDATTASAVASTANDAYTCVGCKLVIHRRCLAGHHPEDPAEWRCDVCLLKQLASSDEPMNITCALCPRRGGYFKRTTEFKWAHLYCAHNAPGQVKVLPDGKIDIRALPKENKKEKCCICNRKSGAPIQCSHVGCTTVFHPLCSARSGKGCIRTRQGEKIAYCFAHVPEGLERLPSGYWVDGYEIERLRYGLERARLILDVLIRREKHKRMICKAETELLTIRFHKALDKAKKRKSKTDDDEVDLSDMSLYDSESEYYSDEDGLAGGDAAGAGDAFVPLEDAFATHPRGEDITVTTSTGEEARVSGAWTKRGEVRLPRRLGITLCGIEVDRKDAHREVNQRGFMKHYQNVIVKNSNAMRQATQIFTSAQDELEFGRSVAPKLKKHMAMPMEDFVAAMRTVPWLKLKGDGLSVDTSSAVKKPPGKVGRPKKGYAIVYEPEEPAAEADSEPSDQESVRGRRASRGGGAAPATAPGKRGRPRAMSEADRETVVSSSTPSEVKRGRGRPRKQQSLDNWLAPSAASGPPPKGAEKKVTSLEALSTPRRGGRGARGAAAIEEASEPEAEAVEEEEVVQEAPARKKTKKQLREEEEAAAEREYAEAMKSRKGRSSNAAPAPAPAPASSKTVDQQVSASFPQLSKLSRGQSGAGRGAKRGPEEVEEAAEEGARAKRQRGRASASAEPSAAPSRQVSSVDLVAAEAPVVNPAEVHKLSGPISREDSKKYAASTLYLLERRLKDILNDIESVEVPDFTEEELYGAGMPKPKKKHKKGSAAPEHGTRRLAEDFESVPYDAIPEYDQLVPRVVTLDTMQETLSAHKYKSMAEFVEDFYQLLNNARSITPEGSVTWTDAEKLAEHFEQFRAQSVSDPSAAKPRAPGREIVAAKQSGPSVSGVPPPNTNVPARGGKMKWTCACCKSLYHVSNWPADFDITAPYVSSADADADANANAAASNTSAAPSVSAVEESGATTCFVPKTHAWASALISSSGSTEFQYPLDFAHNTRDSRDRRERKEQQLREQWDKALEEAKAGGGNGAGGSAVPSAGTTPRTTQAKPWAWLCPQCVQDLGAALIGADVTVWWHDDAQCYRGVIDAFDEASQCHRVLYEDNEWEFVNLAIEPAAFGSAEDFVLPQQASGSKSRK